MHIPQAMIDLGLNAILIELCIIQLGSENMSNNINTIRRFSFSFYPQFATQNQIKALIVSNYNKFQRIMLLSKTEPFPGYHFYDNYNSETENDNANELQPQFVTSTTPLPVLNKALANIEQLQQNLSFMLEYNTQLQQQNAKLKKSLAVATDRINEEVKKYENKVKLMEIENENIAFLLEEAKQSLMSNEEEIINAREEIQRCQNIIKKQKVTIEHLENYNMNVSIGEGDSSLIFKGKQQQQIVELERENNELQLLVRKLEQVNERNELKMGELERENCEFKKWMASVLGLNKVVGKSEKILMKEIAQRMI